MTREKQQQIKKRNVVDLAAWLARKTAGKKQSAPAHVSSSWRCVENSNVWLSESRSNEPSVNVWIGDRSNNSWRAESVRVRKELSSYD